MIAAPNAELAISGSIHVCQLQNPQERRIARRESGSVVLVQERIQVPAALGLEAAAHRATGLGARLDQPEIADELLGHSRASAWT
jgi:hypothetical protein